MTNPTATTPPARKLKLPDLDDAEMIGGRWVYRAVSLTFGTLVLLAGGALLLSVLVSMNITVDASGTLEPARLWPVRSHESGVIEQMLVSTGDTVHAGQPLARLDSLQLAAALAQLEGDHRTRMLDLERARSSTPIDQRRQHEARAQAEARLMGARATLRQRVAEYGLGTNVDSVLASYRRGTHVGIDLALADVLSVEAELRGNTAEFDRIRLQRLELDKQRELLEQLGTPIETARARLRRLVIRAPADGVVLTDRLEHLRGSLVHEGEQLFEIADLSSWHAFLYVPERDVYRVRPGDPVQVEVRAFGASGRELFRGAVTSVAADPVQSEVVAARPSQASGIYRVVVAMNPVDLARAGHDRFRRGYSVSGKIVTRRGRLISLAWDYVDERIAGRR